MWVDHKVDSAAPEFFGIVWPQYLVSAGVNTVRGYAYDASGVPQITLEIQSPSAGTTTLNCPDATPQDGQWSCDWDTSTALSAGVTATNGGVTPGDGDEFQVRVQATDGFGQVSEWTAWQTFVVDTEPPTVTLDEVASGAADGSLVDTGAYRTFDVPDSFTIGKVSFGFNATHTRRNDIVAVTPPWWATIRGRCPTIPT